MTRYNENDGEIWQTKYNNCDCDEISSLQEAQAVIDQFIAANPSYALTSENPKLRKRATDLLNKRREFKGRVGNCLQALNKYGISSEVAILQLPQLKQDVLALNTLLTEISAHNICITQLTKEFVDT